MGTRVPNLRIPSSVLFGKRVTIISQISNELLCGLLLPEQKHRAHHIVGIEAERPALRPSVPQQISEHAAASHGVQCLYIETRLHGEQ